MRLALRYTTVDIHCFCRDKRYEWDGGITTVHWLCLLIVWCVVDFNWTCSETHLSCGLHLTLLQCCIQNAQ